MTHNNSTTQSKHCFKHRILEIDLLWCIRRFYKITRRESVTKTHTSYSKPRESNTSTLLYSASYWSFCYWRFKWQAINTKLNAIRHKAL